MHESEDNYYLCLCLKLKRHELHKSKNTTKVLLQRQLRDSSLGKGLC